MNRYDVVVIGGGPAGLSAAKAAAKKGATVLLTEREAFLGGILKQCIHDGFGIVKYNERLSGCEYAQREIDELNTLMGESRELIDISTMTFVTNIEKLPNSFVLTLVKDTGMEMVQTKALVLATGCRERTPKQVSIHGTRPSGVLTAGTAQNFVNLQGQLPGKEIVILGSGDIGLIMARRLTLEGGRVIGVYEAKPQPSGLSRNVFQCLDDFDIPLHLSETVVALHGRKRLEGVTVAKVDDLMNPIEGTEKYIKCDSLIVSVGLIPENELAETLGVTLSLATKGPFCDESYMTNISGVYSCGNALHVNDLVDYVSESGEIAGESAAEWAKGEREKRDMFALKQDDHFLYVVPQGITNRPRKKLVFFFRTKEPRGKTKVSFTINGKVLISKAYAQLKPPEMERLVVDFENISFDEKTEIRMEMEDLK